MCPESGASLILDLCIMNSELKCGVHIINNYLDPIKDYNIINLINKYLYQKIFSNQLFESLKKYL